MTSILSLTSCVLIIRMFSIDCVMATGPFVGCSITATDVTESNVRPDSGHLVLRQCGAVVCRFLVVMHVAECKGSSRLGLRVAGMSAAAWRGTNRTPTELT